MPAVWQVAWSPSCRIQHGEIQTNGKSQKRQKEEHRKNMENKAQNQRPGPDPLRYEAWDRSQAPKSGRWLWRDGLCTALLLTLRVSPLFVCI